MGKIYCRHHRVEEQSRRSKILERREPQRSEFNFPWNIFVKCGQSTRFQVSQRVLGKGPG